MPERDPTSVFLAAFAAVIGCAFPGWLLGVQGSSLLIAVTLVLGCVCLWVLFTRSREWGAADWAAVQTDIAPGTYRVQAVLCHGLSHHPLTKLLIEHDDDKGWPHNIDQEPRHWYRVYEFPSEGIANVREGDYLIVAGKSPFKTLSVSRHAQVAC